MKTKLFQFEQTRDCLKILREDAKRNRDHCKEVTKSNVKLQKALHKSNENNEKLKVENAKLRDEEKRRMSLLSQNYDPICSSGNSIAWKSAADSSSNISPFGVFDDIGMTMGPGVINTHAGKGAIPRRQKSEGAQKERKRDDSHDYKSQDEVLNLDGAEYLDFKEDDDIPAQRREYELYNPQEYAISPGTELKEQCSQGDLTAEERYDREKDWKLQGR